MCAAVWPNLVTRLVDKRACPMILKERMLEDEIDQERIEESRSKDSRWSKEDGTGSWIAEEMRAAKCVRFQRAAGAA